MKQLESGISQPPNKITVVIIVRVVILIVLIIIAFVIQTIVKYIRSAFTFVPLK